MVISAIGETFTLFPSALAVAVITEDVTLSKDWLSYFAKYAQGFENSLTTIDVVNAFNPNGFTNTSLRGSVVYRTGYSPAYSYMISRSFFDSSIRSKPDCCTEQGQWVLKLRAVTPELSRVSVIQPPEVDPIPWEVPVLFNRARRTSRTESSISPDSLTESAYDDSLKALFTNSTVIEFKNIICDNWKSSKFKSKAITIVVESLEISKAVSVCFGLVYELGYLDGWYKETLRFSTKAFEDVLIVTRKSPFYYLVTPA